MTSVFKKMTGVAVAALMTANVANAETIRIALAETPSEEMAAFFLALDREPPPLNRSTAMFRKRRTMNGKQTTKARRDRYKVTSS